MPQENSSLGMTLFWASPLTITGENENVKPYLLTSPAAYYYEIDSQSPEKLIETNPFIIKNASKSPSAPKGSLILGAEITGPLKGLYNLESTQNSHIIVISDQYFATSLMNGYIGGESGDYRNFEFLTNALLKLNGEEELAALQSRSSRDTSHYKVTDIVSFSTMRLVTYIILFVIVPFSIIAVGVILNVRKEK